MKRERKAIIPKRDYANKKLIDTTDEKFQNSPGLQRWAAVENLKIAAQAYNEAGSIKELEQKIATTAATGKEAKQTVRTLENLNQYLGRTEPPKNAQEQPDRDNNPFR